MTGKLTINNPRLVTLEYEPAEQGCQHAFAKRACMEGHPRVQNQGRAVFTRSDQV